MPSTVAPQRLGTLLLDRGYLSIESLERGARASARRGRGKLLGEILVDLNVCTEEQIVECLAAEYGVPYAKLETRHYDPKIVDLIPRDYIEANLVLPLFLVRDTLTVAVAEPSNLFLIEELRSLTRRNMQIVAATPRDIRRMITGLPNSKVFVIDDIIEDSEAANVMLIEEAIEDIGDVEEIAGQSPVIRLVNFIIYSAVKEGASDIHIEPAERCLRVRTRVDGRLYKSLEVPLHLLGAVTSRIKIMASMDISERRLPQDGRVHVHPRGAEDRPPREHVSDDPRRKDCHPNPRHADRLAPFARPGVCRGRADAVSRVHSCAQRHRAGHWPDRQRQIDNALRRAQLDQLDGQQRLHGRGPDRIQSAANQSVPSA